MVKEAESVETKETSQVTKSDDFPLETAIIEDHATNLKTETVKTLPLIETDEPDNYILDLMGNVRIKSKPEPTLLTNIMDEVCKTTVDDDMDPQEKIQENCEASSSGDKDGEENKNSFEVPIPPKPPPIIVNLKEKDSMAVLKVHITKLLLISVILISPQTLTLIE